MWTQLPIMHMTTITGNVVEGYCDKINIEECYETLVTFKKYPGNDKLIIEFYRKFRPLFGKLFFSCWTTGDFTKTR